MRNLLILGCCAYLLTGFAHVVIGAVLPELLTHYDRSYDGGGVLIFLQFTGFLIGVLCMPLWVKRFGRKRSLLGGFALLGISEIMIGFLPPWPAVMAFCLIAGFGFGSLEGGFGTLILTAFKQRQAVVMSRLEVFFGIGALVMPLIAGGMIYVGAWSASFILLGIMVLVVGWIWSRLQLHKRINQYKEHKAVSDQAATGHTKRRIFAYFAVFIFLYVGIEVCIVEFLPSMMKERFELDASVAAAAVTTYWIAMVLGRAVSGYVAEWMSFRNYLLSSTLFMMAGLAALAVSGTEWLAFGLSFVLGLAMSGMFAMILVDADGVIRGQTEKITGRLIASGGLGGAVLPLLAGVWLDAFGVDSTLLGMAVAALLMLVLYVIMPRGMKKLP